LLGFSFQFPKISYHRNSAECKREKEAAEEVQKIVELALRNKKNSRSSVVTRLSLLHCVEKKFSKNQKKTLPKQLKSAVPEKG
jgi:hypothetical protein